MKHVQDHIKSFLYLTQELNVEKMYRLYSQYDGSSSRDITSRIAKEASAMSRLSNPLFRKHHKSISIRTKINMYRILVVSVLIYGSEAWATILAARNRLDAFDMRCQRRLLRVFWQQHICNQSIRERSKQPTASSLLQQHRLRCTDKSTSYHPPSLYQESMASSQTSMVGKYQVVALQN